MVIGKQTKSAMRKNIFYAVNTFHGVVMEADLIVVLKRDLDVAKCRSKGRGL